MNFLEQHLEKQNTLISLHKAADDRADREQARAEKAEAERDDLKAQIAADEATLKAANDKLDAEIGEETGEADKPTATASPTGAAVLVDPAAGTTTHVADGVTTVLDHVSGSATATDASGTPVEPGPAAVAEAQEAAAAAGVTVPVQG